MENSSPRRNLQPLLDGETPSPRGNIGTGGYAPPTSERHHPQAQVQAQPAQAGQVPVQQPVQMQPQFHHHSTPHHHDLSLTVTDANGEVIPSSSDQYLDGQDDPNLPQLPPLISYCSYVKYGCAFGKWLLLIILANTIAIIAVLSDNNGYFGYNGLLPFDSWKGTFLALVWLISAAWMFMAAKIVERDVEEYDRMAQYEQGRLTEDDDDGVPGISFGGTTGNINTRGGGGEGPVPSPNFIPDYNHIYGQVSRKIDALLGSEKENPTQQQQQQPQQPPVTSGVSSLVNMSFALWALFFGAGTVIGVGNMLGKRYVNSCDPLNGLADGGDDSTEGGNTAKGDFKDIANFPDGVQEWITQDRDPWGGDVLFFDDDDAYNRENPVRPDFDGSFPIAFESDKGLFCSMTDGSLFFSGRQQIPPEDDGSDDGRLVLVQNSPGGQITYHTDIINPRMFIPVEATLDKDKMKTSSCCFAAAKDTDNKNNRQRSWDVIVRITNFYCINSKSDSQGEFDIQKVIVGWKDKSRHGPQLEAASSGNQVLLSHVGQSDEATYQEVVSVDPVAMTFKAVFHLTTTQTNSYYYDGGSEKSRCIQRGVITFSTISGLIVLVACSAWLIIREGVPSGVVPLIYAVVLTMYTLILGWGDISYSGIGWISVILAAGTIFFHSILNCCGGDGRACHLPAWIGREMYIWGLYSWLTAFILIDITGGNGDIMISALVYFALSGIILDHPTVSLMGWIAVAVGILMFVVWPFVGFDVYMLLPATLSFLIGAGMLGVSNCISKSRVYASAICRPVRSTFRTMYYGNQQQPRGRTTTTTTTATTAAAAGGVPLSA